MNLFSHCLFGHAEHPLTTVQNGVAHWECRRCAADLGAILGVRGTDDRSAQEHAIGFRSEALKGSNSLRVFHFGRKGPANV
jgi:hypothetical protein